VGDDEIIFFFGRRGEVQGVGVVDLQAGCEVGVGRLAATAEEFEHDGAGVDGVGVEARVLHEELREESAVSVAEDEGSFFLEEVGEVVEAAAFEGGAEGEVFEPAIRASYGVEVHFGGSGLRHGLVTRWLEWKGTLGMRGCCWWGFLGWREKNKQQQKRNARVLRRALNDNPKPDDNLD
jgi:hypothetical protein